jgi:hypothetical protein
MLRWASRAGITSRKMGIRCGRGTGVEAPKPGLLGGQFGCFGTR